MSIDTSITKKQAQNSKWREAIRDAKERITFLQKAIEYYRKMDKRREPWPVTQSGGQESTRQHSV
jgi:hypothetical protein